MTLIDQLYNTFMVNRSRVSFSDTSGNHTYGEFLQMVSGIRSLLDEASPGDNREPVAIVSRNCMESYASLFACWFSGHPYVPLNASNPVSWNRKILKKLNVNILIDKASDNPGYDDESLRMVCTAVIPAVRETGPVNREPGNPVYILTTSGTTGEPRHVPVSLHNLHAFLKGFTGTFPMMDKNDRFLQTYDLTADAAVTAFLVPLYLGATVVLSPDHPFRYLSVAKSLLKNNLSWVQVTPSLLSGLRPYFGEMKLVNIRYFQFGGEALTEELVNEFRRCVPNAEIANIYGPTETTVTSLVYRCPPGERLRSFNGSVSIGKPIGENKLLVINDDGNPVMGKGEGELLIAGPQVMSGYYHPESPACFYDHTENGCNERYYRTGDKVMRDDDGYYYFLGRLNNQVKISGYRIDPQEVEKAFTALFGHSGFVAVTPEITPEKRKLVVFTTGNAGNEAQMKKRISENYPGYFIPDSVMQIDRLPLNLAGKTDRKKLEQIYLASQQNEGRRT